MALHGVVWAIQGSFGPDSRDRPAGLTKLWMGHGKRDWTGHCIEKEKFYVAQYLHSGFYYIYILSCCW